MVAVHTVVQVEAPVATTFAYLDDHRNATRFVVGLRSWEPVGEQSHGLGAVFRAEIALGPKTVGGTLVIDRWEQDRIIGWRPQSGLAQQGGWTLTERDGGTSVRFDLDVTLPGGIVGRALGKGFEGVVRGQVEESGRRIKQQVEALGSP